MSSQCPNIVDQHSYIIYLIRFLGTFIFVIPNVYWLTRLYQQEEWKQLHTLPRVDQLVPDLKRGNMKTGNNNNYLVLKTLLKCRNTKNKVAIKGKNIFLK